MPSASRGEFALEPAEFAGIGRFGFASGSSTHADRVATIADTWRRHDTLIDTHTADGLKVAREHREPGVPMIVLETALPAKFAATIVEAIGREPPRPAGPRGTGGPAEALRGHAGRCRRRQGVHRRARPMKVIGFCGYSGSGKTTLVEQLIARLRLAGQRVSVVKHAHHDFDIDQPGKDSWRHRQAGAFEVVIASDRRLAKIREFEVHADPTVHQLLAELVPCDWVLVEGFKHADLLKIEVWRAATGKPAQYPSDPYVVAVSTDSPGAASGAHRPAAAGPQLGRCHRRLPAGQSRSL